MTTQEDFRTTQSKISAAFGPARLGRTKPLTDLNNNQLRDLVERNENRAESMAITMAILLNPNGSPYAHFDLSKLKKGQSGQLDVSNQEQLEQATAAAILVAGRKARGEVQQEPEPIGTTAKLILLAGRKRRGEI